MKTEVYTKFMPSLFSISKEEKTELHQEERPEEGFIRCV